MPRNMMAHNMYLSNKIININRSLQSHQGLLMGPEIMVEWAGFLFR